jgi:hypothetical protein
MEWEVIPGLTERRKSPLSRISRDFAAVRAQTRLGHAHLVFWHHNQ